MSNYVYQEIRDIAFIAETDSAYGVSQSGSATYESLPFIAGAEIGVGTREMIPRNHSRQKKFDRSVSQPGLKSVSMTLPMHLEGAQTPLSGAASPGLGPSYGKVLRTVMGGFHASIGSTVSATGSAGSFDVVLDQFKVGQIVGHINSSTGKMEASQIRSKDAGGINLLTSFGESPALGDVIYGAYNYHLIQNPTGSLQFLATGEDAQDTWIATGMQGGFGFTLELGQLPVITFNLEGATWLSGATGAVTRKDHGDLAIPVFSDSRVLFYASGSFPVAASPVAFSAITVTPNIAFNNVRGAHGVETIVRKVLAPTPQDQGAISAQLTLYFEDRTYLEALEEGTEYGLLIQVGSEPGNTWVLSIPRCQITAAPKAEANDGLAGWQVTVAAFHNSYCEASTGFEDLAEAPFVIASL